MKPMNEEEAMLELELLGHDFFIFKDLDFIGEGLEIIEKHRVPGCGDVDFVRQADQGGQIGQAHSVSVRHQELRRVFTRIHQVGFPMPPGNLNNRPGMFRGGNIEQIRIFADEEA